jgi:Flp pilus assembly protein TadG
MRSTLDVIGSCVRGLRSLRRDRNANVTVFAALTAPILVGFIGLAIDASTWSNAKTSVQGAADQAALSAATAATAGESSIQNEVTSVAKLNGYVDGVKGAGVTYTKLTTGAYTPTAPGYQVVITQSQNLYFSSIFLSAPPTVSGRSVAMQAVAPPCVLSLATSGNAIAESGGSTNITGTNCDIDANSSSSSAVTLSGGASLSASDLNIMGNYQTSGGSSVGATTKIKTGVTTPDPYASLSIPAFSGCDQTGYTLRAGSATISPGVYCNGITVKGGGHLTMNPGTYIINGGGFTVSASSVSGAGVGVAMTGATGTWGQINISGGSSISLAAPSSGTMQGVVFYMDRNAPSNITQTISGTSSLSLTGSVYLPSQPLTFTGGSSGTVASCLQLIALSFNFSGGSSFGRSCGSTIVPGLQSAGKGVPVE